jgi:hypothetical protein
LHIGGQNVWYLSEQWSAIADTGTTLLLLGKDVVDLYYSSGVPRAQRNVSIGGIWTYPCAGEALPDFEMGFKNGWVATVPGRFMNYSVMPDDLSTWYVLPLSRTSCLSWRRGGIQPWKKGLTLFSMGGLQAFGLEDFGILGDIFLKAVYAVFDVGGARIGFADKPLHLE